MGPEHAYLHDIGRVNYVTATDEEAVDAFFKLSRYEGIIPALESSHAIAYAMKWAQENPGRAILVNCSGRGDKDVDYVVKTTATEKPPVPRLTPPLPACTADGTRLPLHAIRRAFSGFLHSPHERTLRLVQRTFHVTPREEDFRTIALGASGRTIVRIGLGDRTCIGILWGDDRADNDSFIPTDRHLRANGVNVPEVYDYEPLAPGCGQPLAEDLGNDNLLSFRSESWEKLRSRYIRAMEQLRLLHECPFQENFSFQPSFDESLYRWEQEYFAEHLLGTHLGLSADGFLNHPRCGKWRNSWPGCRSARSPGQPVPERAHPCGKNLADRLPGHARRPPEYDLASLVFDGYAHLEAEQTDELLREWEHLTGRALDRDIFCACALQRLMQMLGAYANIGHNKGKTWYLKQIPAGLAHLRRLLPVPCLPSRWQAC